MKNIPNKLIILLFITLSFPHFGFSQEPSSHELRFEVNKAYPSISISKEQLNKALTLIDLNTYYDSAWVKEYISVEVLASFEGKIKKIKGKNDTLSLEQQEFMKMADAGTDISVKVHYIPENNLKHNEAREMNFTFSIDPDKDASFPGGPQQLNQYLRENAIDNIPAGSFQGYDLATVKFSIDETGKVINPYVFWPSKKEEIEEMLLEAIGNMPDWLPASYGNGKNVKQEFVLTVGNMENCVINLLNIRHDSLKK